MAALTLLDALLIGDVPLAQRSVNVLEQVLRERAAAILSSSASSSSKKKLVKAPTVIARKRGSGSSPAPVIAEVVSTTSAAVPDYDPRADFEVLGLVAVAVRSAGAGTTSVSTAPPPPNGEQQPTAAESPLLSIAVESLRVSCGTFFLTQMKTFGAAQMREVVGTAKEPL
jgi:hypothetical protein